MIFHENRLLADDSHVISYLIFVKNWGKCGKIYHLGALRVNHLHKSNLQRCTQDALQYVIERPQINPAPAE